MTEGSTGDLRPGREREKKGGRNSRQTLRPRKEKKERKKKKLLSIHICHILKTAALKPSAIDVFWLRKHSFASDFCSLDVYSMRVGLITAVRPLC